MTPGNGQLTPSTIHPETIRRNEEEKEEMRRWKLEIEDRLNTLEAQVEIIRRRREQEKENP